MAQAPPSPADRLLQRPLYIFALPQELLYGLQLKTRSSTAAPAGGGEADAPPTPRGGDAAAEKGARLCALCGLAFADLHEQRGHVRADVHAYNLKQRMRGEKAVTEGEFEKLVGDLDESLSGSDTSSSGGDGEDDGDDDDDDDDDESTLSALLKRQAKVHHGDADAAPRTRKRAHATPPLLWFTSPKLPPNTSLGLYRAVFSDDEQSREDQLVDTLQRKQLAPQPPPAREQKPKQQHDDQGGVPLAASMLPRVADSPGPHYFLCMIGGGHFAAMLVSLIPKVTKKAGMGDRSASVLAHKTFHRYTTRRKQGGSQSANDNAKGNARSAGSSIRRYNEAALTREVRDLLAEWKPWIDTSELLFVRASGSTSRRTLFGPYDGQVLSVKDERVRGFPFNTRRATQSELMRAFVELTRVKVDVVDEAARAKQAEAAAAAAQKAEAQANNKQRKPNPAKPSQEDEEAALHTTQLQALIRRSKAPGLVSYIQSNALTPDFTFFPPEHNHHAPTPLHLAAASNSPACVTALLLKLGANPTLPNADNKSAFEIARDRPTRDAFRLARSHLGDSAFAWDSAGIPAALSQAEADSRTAREKAEKAEAEAAERSRRAKEVERIRQADQERLVAERESKLGEGPAVVAAGRVMTAEERRAEEARGMSEEMRVRLEREKRARAAEERMRRLQGR
ncbi:hypothetical protein EJ03DRAFT_328575 [Teratosphaeria nubilosa]|uniref:VLRF1 domain-containing protein n=1 Tax=Teratosphaeria nubilosa TaxID=161662 RepID=A0A6G1L5K5_9PEZI|nr:hypothetical protein EJ03DRAFT_328575 [Teratosphaeria nubilosa]